jgi:hypothetical protein
MSTENHPLKVSREANQKRTLQSVSMSHSVKECPSFGVVDSRRLELLSASEETTIHSQGDRSDIEKKISEDSKMLLLKI